MVKPDEIIGLQWGDEGKGKVTDVEAGKHDVVVRFQGGGNAGHTMEVKGTEFITHYIPSGMGRGHEKQQGLSSGKVFFFLKRDFLLKSFGAERRKGIRPGKHRKRSP